MAYCCAYETGISSSAMAHQTESIYFVYNSIFKLNKISVKSKSRKEINRLFLTQNDSASVESISLGPIFYGMLKSKPIHISNEQIRAETPEMGITYFFGNIMIASFSTRSQANYFVFFYCGVIHHA